MSNVRPIGKMLKLKPLFGGQKVTEQGIIYNETTSKSRLIWAEVVAIGDKLTEDIKVGDKVCWDLTAKFTKHHSGEFDIISQDAIAMVLRD
jgi:co-chaperonin GroES (HSP10)